MNITIPRDGNVLILEAQRTLAVLTAGVDRLPPP